MIKIIIDDLQKEFPNYFDKDKINWETKLKINSKKEIEVFIHYLLLKLK